MAHQCEFCGDWKENFTKIQFWCAEGEDSWELCDEGEACDKCLPDILNDPAYKDNVTVGLAENE